MLWSVYRVHQYYTKEHRVRNTSSKGDFEVEDRVKQMVVVLL